MSQSSFADWVSAGANVVLALSVIWGGVVAFRRWPVAFRLKAGDGPFYGQSTINGVASPPYVSWFLDITLVAGDVAHIGSVRVERRRRLRWELDREASKAIGKVPRSLSHGESFSLFVSSDQADEAPIRVTLREYRSLRQTKLPFLPARESGRFKPPSA